MKATSSQGTAVIESSSEYIIIVSIQFFEKRMERKVPNAKSNNSGLRNAQHSGNWGM
jgi:hypothetical protein